MNLQVIKRASRWWSGWVERNKTNGHLEMSFFHLFYLLPCSGNDRNWISWYIFSQIL